MIAFAYYLLKVMICSGVLFLYYHLALRNKLFHQWNRFYLLAAVALSLLAPIIQLSIVRYATEQPNKALQVLKVFESADGYMDEVIIQGHRSFSAEQWAGMAYLFVSLILFLSVITSLIKIYSIVRSHSITWIENIRFINSKVKGTPFSFFRYIFWNEKIDLQTETGQQIFQHELVHVKEKHTVDKLFIQLVLVAFWCNPFFWLIRRELKLIHEFMADQKAVGEHGTAALAAMILSSTYPSQFNSITNPFFQTSIKRRLAMLAKIQNPKMNYLSRILALPILALTVLAFTLRTKHVVSSVKLDKPITVIIDAGHGIMDNGKHNGAAVDNVYEDDIVLAIAKKIKELNSNDKIKIILTRGSESIVDLHKRVDIAKENNADLFISLHLNAADPNQDPDSYSNQSTKGGIEIYVSNKEPFYQQQSELLGSILQQQLGSVYPTNSYLLKRKTSVWVLDQNVCPSVLVECGFLTDQKDRDFISKKKNQAAIAEKILMSVEQYARNQQSFAQTQLDTVPQLSGYIKIKNADALTNESGKITLESSEVIFNTTPKLPSSNVLLIINGKEASISSLEGKRITSKKAIIYEKNNKEAITKYGDAAKNGMVIFEDAVISNASEEKIDSETVARTRPLSFNAEKPLFVLDGKEVSKEEVDNVDPALIESINVLKDNPATEKYGKKGSNGVIEITTNPNNRSDGIDIQKNGEPFTTVKGAYSKLNKDTIPRKEPVFTKVEIEASVNEKEWKAFLQKNLQPVIKNATANGMKAGTYTVMVRFLVKKDGSISDFKALNDPGYGLAPKVLEMMKDSPKWNAGIQNRKTVNSYHTQPITFVIQEQ